MKTALTVGGFVAAAALVAMAAVMIAALNLVLNGYHRECGIWRNLVPLMCSPAKERAPAGVRYGAASEPGRAPVRSSRPGPPLPSAPKQALRASPKPPSNPHTGRREPWGCGPLQPEPARVQCDPGTGICYHDLGYRANCGVAHDWSDGQ